MNCPPLCDCRRGDRPSGDESAWPRACPCLPPECHAGSNAERRTAPTVAAGAAERCTALVEVTRRYPTRKENLSTKSASPWVCERHRSVRGTVADHGGRSLGQGRDGHKGKSALHKHASATGTTRTRSILLGPPLSQSGRQSGRHVAFRVNRSGNGSESGPRQTLPTTRRAFCPSPRLCYDSSLGLAPNR